MKKPYLFFSCPTKEFVMGNLCLGRRRLKSALTALHNFIRKFNENLTSTAGCSWAKCLADSGCDPSPIGGVSLHTTLEAGSSRVMFHSDPPQANRRTQIYPETTRNRGTFDLQCPLICGGAAGARWKLFEKTQGTVSPPPP